MKTDDLCLSALSGAERHRHPHGTAIPHGFTKDAYLSAVNDKIPHLACRGQEVGAELLKNSERLKERLGRNFRLYYFNLNEVLSNER